MQRSILRILFLLGFLLCVSHRIYGESLTCLTIYKQGGAPAVFQSPKCPRWKLSDHRSKSPPLTCSSAMLQGRRKSQEDRTICALDLQIPFPGKEGIQMVSVGIVAVFDGHNGAEASEMASKLLLEYFLLHTYFLLDATYSVALKKSTGSSPSNGDQEIVFQVLDADEGIDQYESNLGRFKLTWKAILDGSFHLDIFKESLLRAITTVILLADGQILVANVGDSKALLCSERIQSPAEAKGTWYRLYKQKRLTGSMSPEKDCGSFKMMTTKGLAHFFVQELTRDHRPDREDERYRVETAGGYVKDWSGVARVNGQLAVSRAIGDISFKSYGVISAPEVTDWLPLTANDSYLVAASDGIFEKLSTQDVCDLLWAVHGRSTLRSKLPPSCSYSLADCIVDTAFERGSMDNLAAVVVQLKATGFSQNLLKVWPQEKGNSDCSVLGLQKFGCEQSENGIIYNIARLADSHPLMAKFNRLLVQRKYGSFGCFYLSENLDENVDYSFLSQSNNQEDDAYGLTQALPQATDHRYGGLLDLYSDQRFCLTFGMTQDGVKDQCIYPEGFARFLGLLESIPFAYSGPKYGSSEYATPDLRYALKKRFGRGSYGEVWLAFHWNCSRASNASDGSQHKNPLFHSEFYDISQQSNTSRKDCHAGYSDENMFILKRIMVERGTNVYLSGLREKYFGEIFLNASMNVGAELSEDMSKGSTWNSEVLMEINRTEFYQMGHSLGHGNIFKNIVKPQTNVFEEGLNHIARYVESFESQSNEIWLVFHYEGLSLSKLIYTMEEIEKEVSGGREEQVKHVQILRPSKWWKWLKTTEAGEEEMRNIIWQLLMALKSCHDRNITHRDIKPENMVICFEDQSTGRCLRRTPSNNVKYNTKLRIIDFGSALDEFTIKHLYGTAGPSRAEQTHEYAPPEAFLNASWYRGSSSTTLKYDMWSVGAVILELILGSPNVFQIHPLTRALLDQHLEGWNDDLKEIAYKLRSFMEMCILIPGSSSKHYRVGKKKDEVGVSPASWRCSEESFSDQIKTRDPLKIGFPNIWALRLVRQLLMWDPSSTKPGAKMFSELVLLLDIVGFIPGDSSILGKCNDQRKMTIDFCIGCLIEGYGKHLKREGHPCTIHLLVLRIFKQSSLTGFFYQLKHPNGI
ncbi:Protein kinase domain [Dillenia turbinata]|uniref:Protein kinase domain n=1 Tax=Dillenia turbinata TaxID=194707 RepID=A0AAN8W1V6_9MAGN